jgi:DNA-binding HxlR family transcriptional regulator
MQKRTVNHQAELQFCPIRTILDGLGDKWTILVLFLLKEKVHRFSELRRAIPDISQRMLTQTLRNLEKDGIITRTVTPIIPPRVDYELTELGTSLTERLSPLAQWASENLQKIFASRISYEN